MRAPTEDEQTLFLALQEEARRLGNSSRAKAKEAQTAFDLWTVSQGPGPTFDLMRDWKLTQLLEQAVRDRIDALVEELFLD